MSPVTVIILIIVILVVIAAIAFGVRIGRRRKLQKTFGPEYDHAVADTGSRANAEKELRERERRHAELELKPLTQESQAKYAAAWEEVQIQFVDNPEQAVNTADDLVGRLMSERGYPTGDYDERLANLSVEHARTLDHYRQAHDISQRNQNGQAGTEDLRQALVHHRALFADLLGTDPVATETARTLPGTPTAHSAGTVDTAGRSPSIPSAVGTPTAHSTDTTDTAGRSPSNPSAAGTPTAHSAGTDGAAGVADRTDGFDRSGRSDRSEAATRDATTTSSDADQTPSRPDAR